MAINMAINNSGAVGIGEFRQRAAELIRYVEEEGGSIIIARRGHPVAELRALATVGAPLLGSVMVDDGVDLTAPVVEPSHWSAG